MGNVLCRRRQEATGIFKPGIAAGAPTATQLDGRLRVPMHKIVALVGDALVCRGRPTSSGRKRATQPSRNRNVMGTF